ncbi:hypothetical protein M0R45_027972 [Rubus argutus]|uniref:Transmembrane protein n=1 Tax=Rubus argutus TaxID=59490 RepID=A0AAW1W4H4_RUBAR
MDQNKLHLNVKQIQKEEEVNGPTTYKAETGIPVNCSRVNMYVQLLLLLIIILPIISLPISKAAADDHENCPISNCSDSGPVIRFPFRLRQDPLHLWPPRL